MKKHWSVEERIEGWKALSVYAGFSVKVLSEAAKKGSFEVYRLRRRVFFLKSEIDRWLEEGVFVAKVE